MEKLVLFYIKGVGMGAIEKFFVSQKVKAKLNEVVPRGEFKEEGVLAEIYIEESNLESLRASFRALKGAEVEFVGIVNMEMKL